MGTYITASNCILFITFQWLEVAKKEEEADTIPETEIKGQDQITGLREKSLIVSINIARALVIIFTEWSAN